MINPDLVTVRRSFDPRFINIDYQGVEIGHIRLDADDRVDRHRAIHFDDRPVVDLVARLLSQLA